MSFGDMKGMEFNMANQYKIDAVANDSSEARASMMEKWQASIKESAKQRTSVTPKDISRQNADLEQKIRNGEIDCPTCSARQYVDESNDGGVSFQAPRGLSSSTAASAVMNHEWEHVAESKREQQESGVATKTTVSLERAVCPMCGKSYIAGGTTVTTRQPMPRSHDEPKLGVLDITV